MLELRRTATKKKPSSVQFALPALLILATALLAWALSPTTVLEVRSGPGGPLLKSLPVSTGDRVVYSYIHSIQKTRVDEMLEVGTDGHMIVRETLYDMAGVGLPSDVTDGDFSIDPVTKKFHITNMNRDIPEWRVRVGTIAEQTLEVNGDEFRFDSLASPMTLLVIGPASRPRLTSLLGL